MALYFGWHAATGRPWGGPRLHLNLALAWGPYLCALGAVALAERRPRPRGRLWLLGSTWLAFFPNAPYLITDWLYLPGWTAELWYSIVLLTTFSMCGILLSVVTLYLMHNLVRAAAGPAAGWAVAGLAIGLSGVGVYLGRFLRLNSWDLVTDPGAVYRDVTARLRDHARDPSPVGFAALFAVLLLVFYLVFRSIRLGPRAPDEGGG
jgi:uncharacterized membrane protein